MKALLKYQRLTLWWALFIFIMCNAQLGGIEESHRFFAGFDKLVHCGLFFVFVVLCGHGIIRRQQKQRLTYKKTLEVLLLAVIFGGIIELLQLYIFTWRDGNWNDLFADAVGASMGLFSVLITINAIDEIKK
jgi:VanZ family protein